MNPKDRDEAVKWMLLGYETHGLAGLTAVADSFGISLGANSPRRRPTNTTAQVRESLLTTQGRYTLAADEQTAPSEYRFRFGSTSQPDRPPLACPRTPPRNDPMWRPYVGDPAVFHCGFEGFLENRKPSPDWPIGECFYDEAGQLVDEGHPHGDCRGTPDQYGAEDWIGHTFFDSGGIVRSGGPALWESWWYSPDDRRQWEQQFRRHRRPR
ncbi:MAG TPA: hypothetical protein VG742_15545 [Dongiaceae bacterium]|nr:hypothetical protein [Dongiaceae bacterium]